MLNITCSVFIIQLISKRTEVLNQMDLPSQHPFGLTSNRCMGFHPALHKRPLQLKQEVSASDIPNTSNIKNITFLMDYFTDGMSCSLLIIVNNLQIESLFQEFGIN